MTTFETGERAATVRLPVPRRGDALPEPPALWQAGGGPLHQQLHGVLTRAVDAAGLQHGDRIWSESDLMRHYEVSRHVVRQALNQLVLEGRLSVRKGAGYFVNRRRIVRRLPGLGGLSAGLAEDLAGMPEPWTVEVLDVGAAPVADALEEGLAGRRHRVHRVRRICRLAGEPVALLTGAYPPSTGRMLTRSAVARTGVHETLGANGRGPDHADVVLGVTFASAEESELLEVAEGTPLVCVRCRMRSGTGDLVEVTRELYRSDRFEFGYAAAAAGS